MMCMQHVPTIAIVGRPNVGKSAIFNRMAGRRIAIVHDEPGVTRDRLSAPCKITDRACKIMDTGGIGARLSDGFAEQVEAEADIAIKTADLILFVLDCRDHLTPIDQSIADHLRPAWNTPNLCGHPEIRACGRQHIFYRKAASSTRMKRLSSKVST